MRIQTSRRARPAERPACETVPDDGSLQPQPLVATEAQLIAAAATFDVLSVASRLHLVLLLAAKESYVSTLATRTGATIAATSQQLAKLRAAGIVSARRVGRHQLYRVDDPHILAVVEQMMSHIAPDGTLAPNPGGRSSRHRRPRFTPICEE